MVDHFEHRRNYCSGLWRGRVGLAKALPDRHRPQSFVGRARPALCRDFWRSHRRTDAFDAPANQCRDRFWRYFRYVCATSRRGRYRNCRNDAADIASHLEFRRIAPSVFAHARP